MSKAILNPKDISSRGIISNFQKEEKQIQQNGIDLTVNSIFEVDTNEPCLLTEQNRKRPNSKKIPLVDYEGERCYFLKKGGLYDILFNEDIKLPNDVSGMIMQRSSLNRMGAFVTTGWWDSWFENKVGGILRPSIDIYIWENTRLAQFIAFSSDSASMYDWIYKK